MIQLANGLTYRLNFAVSDAVISFFGWDEVSDCNAAEARRSFYPLEMERNISERCSLMDGENKSM